MEDEATAPWAFLLAWVDQREGALYHRQLKGGATSSRWRPPEHAPHQPTAAPSNSDAAVQKPSITALLRALCSAVVAAVIAVSTRLSASGGAMPVLAATRLARYVRSSDEIPCRPVAASRMRPASARL